MNKKDKARVEEIMTNFDFKNVYDVMKHLNWKWSMGNGRHKVPNLQEIQDEARGMLVDAVNGCPYSTGGFEVSFSEGLLTLKFVLEEYWS